MANDDILKEIRERKELATAGWQDIRNEAETDMKFVGGDPWDDDDKRQRKGRPTVAPEEMNQYFNQVINSLMANPRGMKFSPTGNGANDKGAEFYQNKARETEYRSNAPNAYITAATNAIQRSYGYVRVNTRYASPRSANQEIWIEAMPDPDLVLLDPEAKLPDSSDMTFAFVHSWTEQSEHKRRNKLNISNFNDFASAHPSWISGTKVLEAEYWKIDTSPRKLLLVQLPAPPATGSPRVVAPLPQRPPQQVQMFEDELKAMIAKLGKLPDGAEVLRELRTVDYPKVMQYFTNGLEILGDPTEWPGKYIPIVSCFGKVLYVPDGGVTKRKILSMTRFGRDPWKSYCYACSQQLEILGRIPKASTMVIEGQLAGHEKDWQEAPHVPKAYLQYKALTAATGQQLLPPPQVTEYSGGPELQALEMVKEGFRRAIQSAMGSNFLPTQAQRRNEKSGKALDKMEQAAAQGTYHFVYSYEGMIRQVAVIYEDLCDKIHDYMGDVGVIKADGTAESIRINDPNDPQAISTKGDYLVTVSSGPSSDSERDAASEFTDTVVSNLATVMQVSGPQAAAKVLAHSIRMRTELGAMGEQLADMIAPREQKGRDGKPLSPEAQAAQGQIQQLEQKLQQAGQIIQGEQVKADHDLKVETMKANTNARLQISLKRMDIAAKIETARITAAKQSADLAAEATEERIALALEQNHESDQAAFDRQHDVTMAAIDHRATLREGAQTHDQALEQGDAATAGALAQQQQAADLAPPPEPGA